MRAEELGGRVPELPNVVGLLGVEAIFKGGVALVEERVEVRGGVDAGEGERFAWVENYGLGGEVAIGWIIKTVFTSI